VRKHAVSAMMLFDGVMQACGGPVEDQTGGFTRGGWGVNDVDEETVVERYQ
jgi:hypothetical protein